MGQLCAESVSVRYPGTETSAVADVSLTVGPGDAVGIVGESGSGKTTLARTLVGLTAPTTGHVTVDGSPWDRIRGRHPLRRAVQMVFQDPYRSLNPRMSPRSAVAEAIALWSDCGSREARHRAAGLLERVGLRGDVIDRLPASLSGGERQRTGIARALACRPEVLIADEPTASLDVSVQAQILNLLAQLRREEGLGLVIVSHDLAVVHHMTDWLHVMYRGRVVENGDTPSIFAAPRHPYTQLLLASVPGSAAPEFPRVEHRDDVEQSGCDFAHRCPFREERCLLEVPSLPVRSGAACHLPTVPS